MNRLFTRISALGVAVLLGLSLAACKPGNEGGVDSEGNAKPLKSNTTLKFTLPGDVAPQAEKQVLKAVEEKLKADGLDFKLEFTYLPWGEYWNSVSMIAAAQEDYDIFWSHSSTIGGMISANAMAPLNAAIEAYGSELKANIPDYYWQGVTVDEKIYAIPRTAPVAAGQQMAYIRGDLLEKYKMEVPTTYEEMEKYFANVKKNEKNMKSMDQDHSEWMLREFGQIYFPLGSFSKWPVYIDVSEDNMVVKSWYESEYFKTICQRNRDFYTKGYRHAERGTVTDAESYFANSQLATIWSTELKPTERADALYAKDPSIKGVNVMLNPDGDKYIFSAVDNAVSVYDSSKNVNEAVAFFNWLRSSQENYDLFSFGVEGVNYHAVGAQVSYDGISEANRYAPPSFAWTDTRFERYSDKLDPAYIEELKSWDQSAKISPLNGFIVNTTPFQTEYAQIQAVEGEYVEDLTYGVTDYNKVYNDFLKKLKDCDIDVLVKEIQKQVDAFLAAK